MIAAGCDPVKAYRGGKAILAEIGRLIDRPISQAELKRTVEYVCGRFRLRLDSAPMGWIAGRLLFGLKPDAEGMIEGLRALRPADLQRTAERYFQPEGLAMSIVAPQKVVQSAETWASLMKY